jgi:wyosine [tRNA(Phe)-imidazoG37] synthetase (radical SAM superfamily)
VLAGADHSALYDVVSDHLEKVLNTLTTSIGAYVQSRSFSNVNRPHAAQSITTIVSGVQIFKPVASLLIEYVQIRLL